jgi:soluble lytic murein transglycosylase
VERKDSADLRVVTVLERAAQGLDERTRSEVARTVSDLAKTYKIDPLLILAVMKVESTFNPKAISNAQAYGLMQVRKIVVKDVATELGINPHDGDRLLSSHTFNIRVGVHYLSKLLIKFRGDVKKALMAYNAGPTSVERNYKGRSVPEGGYQGKVLKTYRELSSS